MYNGLKGTLIFALGAAIGSAVTWRVLKTKYEQIVQEEIDSFKAKMATKLEPENDEPEFDDSDNIIMTEYRDLASRYSTEKGGPEPIKSHIKVLTPDEFAEDEEYEAETLIEWSDGKLSDDRGNLVEDIDDLVGADYADHFCEYEEYSIYIRNEKYKCEYEIVQDLRTYDEVFGSDGPDLTDEDDTV